ncbi:MAG: hypothetical protein ACRC8S_00615 [Fimbriiglobus sp.]
MPTTMPDFLIPFTHSELAQPLVMLEKGLGRRVAEAWQRACQESLRTGLAEPLHTSRKSYQSTLLAHLKILDGYSELINLSETDDHLELLREVESDRAELQKHYDSLFPRWQTLEDLEGILLEPLTLSNERLLKLSEKYPPPQSWYDDPNPLHPAE